MKLLDIIGIFAVFAAVAYIGWRSGKQVKNSEDFLMAGRRVGKLRAAFSMAATDVGGASIVGTVAYAYGVGLSGVWWLWCTVPAYILLGTFFIKRLQPLAVETVPEFLEKRYNKNIRYLSSFMQICTHAAALATQFTVAAVSLNVFAGVDKGVALMISVLFVMLYTMGGGLIAVIDTDVFQYIIIILSVLILLPVCLINAGGFSGMQKALPAEFFRLDQLGVWTPLSWTLLCFYSYATNQHFLDRVFASKDTRTAMFSYNFSGVQYFLLAVIMSVIAMAGVILIPGMEADGNSVYPLLVRNFLPTGLAMGGIFCAAMSSADSRIMAATHLFVNDIYKPLIKKDATDKDILKVSRITTVITCLIGFGVSLVSDDLFQIIYVCGVFYAAAVFFPLILGIFNKRVNSAGAFAGIVAAIVVGVIRQFVVTGASGIMGLPTNMLASAAGLIVLLAVSMLTPAPSQEQLVIIGKSE